MKTILIAAVISSMSVMPLFAADGTTNSLEHGQNIEQKKAKMLQHIDQRMSLSQQEKVCVQAAQSHADLMSCREKYRPPKPGDDRQNNKL